MLIASGLISLAYKNHTNAVICIGIAQAIDNYSAPKPWKERSLISKIWSIIIFTLVFSLIGFEVSQRF